MMLRFLGGLAVFLALASPAFAVSKKVDCGHQADVVAALQKARQDRVREAKVVAHVAALDNPWPERYDAMIPLVVPWVYEQTRKTVRDKDLAGAWLELCLAN